jgi:hypothetical protein
VYVVQVKCLLIGLGLAACDLSQHSAADRPEQLDYIVETILAPSCGTAECHSAMKAQSGDVFDSVAGARASFDAHTDLVLTCEALKPPQETPCIGAAPGSYLFRVIDTGVESDVGKGDFMPLDQALSTEDHKLIGDWLNDGALGYTVTVGP